MYASIIIPMGKSLVLPAFAAMHNNPNRIANEGNLAQCLCDWVTLLQHISSHPKNVLELVQKTSMYIGCVDACGFGAGGLWFSDTSPLKPTVWGKVFPKFVIANLVSGKNSNVFITNSDLETAVLLCQWLVLECIAPMSLQYAMTGMFSDNTPTVAWANIQASHEHIKNCQLSPLSLSHSTILTPSQHTHCTQSWPKPSQHDHGQCNLT